MSDESADTGNSSSPPDNIIDTRKIIDPFKFLPGTKSEILAFPQEATLGNAGEQPRSEESASSRSEGSQGSGGQGSGGEDFTHHDLRRASFAMTDLGNAERFAERYRDRLRFCPDIGWLWWDERRWARNGAEERVKLAEHKTVRGVQKEAVALRNSPKDVLLETAKGKDVWLSDKLAAFGRASESHNHLTAISKRASAMLAIGVDELDIDPMKINVANGTLHVAKREDGQPYIELHPHDQKDYITKISPVIYDPEARCPRFDQFMDEVHPPDEANGRAKQRFLDQWAGLSLTGDISEQKLTFHYGKGQLPSRHSNILTPMLGQDRDVDE